MKASSLAKKLLRGFPKEIQEYFHKLDKRCQRRRITLRLSSGLAVNNECGRCSGYFDSFNKELAVALGKGWEHAFSIAIHEAAHAAQEADKRSVWHTKISDNHTKFFQWLAGKNFRNPRVLAMSALVLERDCERRALAEIRKKYSHLIDPEVYKAKAISYVYSYLWMLKTRKWLKKSPYQTKLVNICIKYRMTNSFSLPPELERAFNLYLK